MSGDIERRREIQRPGGISPELLAYLRSQQSGGGEVHLHYHAAAEPVAPAAQPARPDVLARLTPYLVLGVYGLFAVAGIVGLLLVAGPILVALLGSVVAIVIAAAAVVGAVAVLAVVLGHLVDRTTASRLAGSEKVPAQRGKRRRMP